ncbi:insulin-like growth factor 2 mRNA-binding protein 1 isoform X3 [Trichogramma pretiosum]|uniref:insulin-like growth factor 2 mRNA-binding protein 1 isoform X3 n=1 Tax=Trichogramma pretiosum TaxID=7493 RepID=UPI000C7198E1|nr:insulin-like growth factor 2 mRNA-binding protein 1 isoform X3 [Trichogramma pretiosum]
MKGFTGRYYSVPGFRGIVSATKNQLINDGGSGTKIQVANLPAHVRLEDVEQLLSTYGQIQSFEKAQSRDTSTQAFLVSYESSEQAQQAAGQLNGYEYEGSPLKVEMSTAESRRRGRGQRGGVAFSGLPGTGRQTDFPLRILVQSDMVGAIIGRQGSTIRQITQMTRARVDVHRKDNVGSLEKAITIYGNPENCTNACRKILEVMHHEASNTNKGSVDNQQQSQQPQSQQSQQQQQSVNSNNAGAAGEQQQQQQQEAGTGANVEQADANNATNNKSQATSAADVASEADELAAANNQTQKDDFQNVSSGNSSEITLKILAHNNLIGRIIGKGGNTIKRIMQDTDTKITVSSINDINSFNLERIITVKGSIENMSRAESLISNKLRQSYENDLQAMAPQSMMFPGLHPMAMMSTASMGYSSRGPNIYSAGPTPYPYQGTLPAQQGVPTSDAQETTYLYIPNSSVGAIIGTKGSHIRNIIRFSGASVKIAPLEIDKPNDQTSDRKVTIVGSPESQWKAQYLIFEKMREEGFISGSEDVRLTVEILVPSSQVGRIIGKGGQNVRELQRVTGSVIKLSEQQSTPPSADEETTVHIIGPFFSVQSAQRRIRQMVLAPGGAPGSVTGIPGLAGTGMPGTRAGRGSSQDGGVRSRRDDSATSQPGGCATPQQQQSSNSSTSSQPLAQPQAQPSQ